LVGDILPVTERVRDPETVCVKGRVVGIAVTDDVTHAEGLSVRDTESVREPVTLRVKGCVVGTPLTERVMLTEIV